jgi:serine phosphatase RsbU (regulator of sigma subunit)/anti-sigma regulatory factor (Ser/Thr protein kinase)
VSTIVPLLGENGLPERYIAIRTDISQSKRVEIEKAELLEQFKSVAEELKTKSIALERAHEREVEIGNRIQQTLLVTPPAASYPGLLVSAFSQASKGIDGDFFDVFQVGDDIIDVVVGDVMGKGVPAALLGAATKLQFSRSTNELMLARSAHSGLPKPSDIVGLVNRTMAPHLRALDSFVTLVYLRLDLKANTVTWVGCGHEEPLLVNAQSHVTSLGNQHPPMGLFIDETYQQDCQNLMPGDALFLCSDGVSDAIRSNGERLGTALVNETAVRHILAHRTPAISLHALRRDLLLDQVALADDVTMVMLMRQPLHKKIARLEVPVSLDALRKVREFVANQVAGLPEDRASILAAAVEIFTNVIRHTENLVPDAPLELLIENSASAIQLDFKYLGAQFDPPVDPPDTDFAGFPEGGFGLEIIRSACDSVEYLHQDGVNTVRMWMACGQTAPAEKPRLAMSGQ